MDTHTARDLNKLYHSVPVNLTDLVLSPSSTTTPQPNVRITNGYVTVEPLLTHQEQRRRTGLYPPVEPPSQASPSALPTPSSAEYTIGTTHALTCLLTLLTSHLLFTSWPHGGALSTDNNSHCLYTWALLCANNPRKYKDLHIKILQMGTGGGNKLLWAWNIEHRTCRHGYEGRGQQTDTPRTSETELSIFRLLWREQDQSVKSYLNSHCVE